MDNRLRQAFPDAPMHAQIKHPFNALCYSSKSASRSTVRGQYARWRQLHGLPTRCDIPACPFNMCSLLWLGSLLPVILDHVNGNKLDNRSKNLRYLCPNCDSQLPTRGGRNRGRVLEATEGTYVLAGADASQDRTIICKVASASATGVRAKITAGARGVPDDA